MQTFRWEGLIPSRYLAISMTQLLSHTFAHLTGSSFRLKAKLLHNKIFLGLKHTRVNSVKKQDVLLVIIAGYYIELTISDVFSTD